MNLNLQPALSTAKVVIGLMPLVIDAVKTIETVLPASGQGAAKMKLLKDTLQSTYSTLGDVQATFEQAWPALSGIAAAVVATFNTAGLFKTTPPAVAAPAAAAANVVG